MSEEQNPMEQGKFALQRIYVKDLSFESPNAPQCFRDDWKPEIKLDLNTENTKLDDKNIEVTLHVTVTVKNQDKTAFLVDVQQAGLFYVEGFALQQMQALLGSYCPNVLFPYVRETVSDLVGRGGFPQLLLAPVNFDALFMEALKRRAQDAATPATDVH